MSYPRLAPGERADVALLLEATYPFVRGGLSAWVHQIVTGLPELSFALVFIGDVAERYGAMRYRLPDNVVHLQCHYIMEPRIAPPPRSRRGNAAAFEQVRALHAYFHAPAPTASNRVMAELAALLARDEGISHADFLYSERAWEQLTESYTRYATDPSFLDYFWTVRTMHGPIFSLAEAADRMPRARLLHSLCTGYAGFLGALLHHRRQCPLILTEHGIYTKERKIDLSQVEWIKDAEDALGAGLSDDLSYLRRLWIHFFEGLGRLAYDAAETILSITDGNRLRQLADGAPPERVRVVPNGVDLPRFLALREQRPAGVPPVIGFIGRIVPIKDVKTFIRAMRTVCTRLPEARVWLVGNSDEDPEYARECQDLVASLHLDEQVAFLGFRRVDEILPQLGLVVLTSISEGLPLVVLEAFASGVPVVTTDVGACRELVEGGTPEDRALGHAGAVVTIADPEATAREILNLLQDEDCWRQAQRSAIRRVERLYSEEQLFDNYRRIYSERLGR